MLMNVYNGVYMLYDESKEIVSRLMDDINYVCNTGELIPVVFDKFNEIDMVYTEMVREMESIINMSSTSRKRDYNNDNQSCESDIMIVNSSSGSRIRIRPRDTPSYELIAQYVKNSPRVASTKILDIKNKPKAASSQNIRTFLGRKKRIIKTEQKALTAPEITPGKWRNRLSKVVSLIPILPTKKRHEG
jgi:hypothetical protein